MKVHKGMRPHDIVVILKMAALGKKEWMMKDLALELGISASEVSESLNRSAFAGLISEDKKRIMKTALLEFLQYGLKYIYPQYPGAIVRGVATAHSALPLSAQIESNEFIVWPFAEGKSRGQALEPLYPGAPAACLRDTKLYELLSLIDALRIGKAREKTIAINEIKKRLS
ncbi:MAG: hypothetical protein IPK03_02205 [Bacteroidetes bacterium]|nr:hypothetical protein [Bacteroidota bacterium]